MASPERRFYNIPAADRITAETEKALSDRITALENAEPVEPTEPEIPTFIAIKSPDDTVWLITVDDEGELSISEVVED